MSDYIFTQTLDEAMEEWLNNDMHMSARWKDISSEMTSIVYRDMIHDMRKRYRCDSGDHTQEDEEHEQQLWIRWQLVKAKYTRYRTQFMSMDFSEDNDSKTNRDILERSLGQDAERELLGAEVDF